MSSPLSLATGSKRLLLRELPCAEGWSAALLETPFAAADGPHPEYRDAVAWLLTHLRPFERTATHEVFLQFDRMRPKAEIPLMQNNAAYWQPEIGLGVWPHDAPPTTWTKEEFIAAAPGTLRPIMYRVMRVQAEPEAQTSAWRTLLGSGCLVRVASPKPDNFVQDATRYFQPRIADVSLASFPFYVPLLTAEALTSPHESFSAELEAWLPMVEGYMRESAEDGGLLVLSRQSPKSLWQALSGVREQLPFEIQPLMRELTKEDADAWR